MSRPPKCRRVNCLPGVNHFKPAGIPLRLLEEVNVSIEEVEAIRLKDIEGLEQEQCAQSMHISRATFQRVLESARRKIADAVFHGKAIKIAGGNYEMTRRRFRCNGGHEWDVPFEAMISGNPEYCPTCNTVEVSPLEVSAAPAAGRGGGGRRRSGRRF